MARYAVLTLVCLTASAAPAVATPGWKWPVSGPVLQRFALGPDPFARGQHRGIDIGAPAGDRVRAPCTGRVRFAGSVGRAGRTVSLACGRYVVSQQGLAAIAVRAGTSISAGSTIGIAGLRPLHLGVRIEAERFGYVDPLSLLPGDLPVRRGPGPSPPLDAAPRRAPAPPLIPVRGAIPTPSARSLPARLPVPALAGTGLLILTLPGWGMQRVARRRTRRRAQPAAAI